MQYADLTDEQKTVAECHCKTMLVLGGAGTGKTTTALWAARRELERLDAEEPSHAATHRVLFLTFSRTATGRITERANGILPATIANRIDIATFHGFSYRLLSDFGRYAGLVGGEPDLQTPAELKLAPAQTGALTYDDLLPRALKLLRSPLIGSLLTARWSLVLCDEFQDTNDNQWELLELLGKRARLGLLADRNQMIYSFLPGVSDERIALATQRQGSHEIPLPYRSHRDPTQLLPAAAEAIRQRNFSSPAITTAVAAGRLTVRYPIRDDNMITTLVTEIGRLRGDGQDSIGIFVRTNEAVAGTNDALLAAGIPATPVGLSDAAIHAFTAQATIIRAVLGLTTWPETSKALGIYLASVSKGQNAPPVAHALYQLQPIASGLQTLIDALEAEIADAEPDFEAGVAIARTAWPALRLLRGDRPWATAAAAVRVVARRSSGRDAADRLALLDEQEQNIRRAALNIEDDISPGMAQVMNMHQTKGREADATIAVFEEGSFFNARDNYDKDSRLLYVVLTRARQESVLLLPPRPHAFLNPLTGWV